MQWKTHRKSHHNSMRKKYIGTATALVSVALLLSGCASGPPVNLATLAVNQQIATTAQSIHREITGLLAVDQAGVHPTTQRAPTHGVLAQRITLLWSGPMAPAVHAVANLIGYHYRTEGTPPVIAPIVQINTTGERAYDVLRDIGLQAGRHAGVIIHRVNHTLVVSYHGHGRAGGQSASR